jgi:hypothetical protein
VGDWAFLDLLLGVEVAMGDPLVARVGAAEILEVGFFADEEEEKLWLLLEADGE